MSILSEIGRLADAKTDIIAAIEEMGVDVPDESKLDALADYIRSISTGTELNFQIVGGTSRPSNPAENTVWANTATDITSWAFSATEPAATAGMAWIKTGDSSPVSFNALSENVLMVYPVSVFVYDGASWNATVTEVYYDGAWHGFETVLYDGGMVIQFENYGYVSNSSYLYTTRTDNGTDLYAKVQYNLAGNDFYTGYAGWRTTELIDLSQYTTLYIKAKVRDFWSSYNGVRVEFWDENNNSVGTISIIQDSASTVDSEWTFDLSAFNSPVKVGVSAWQTYSNARGAEFNLYKMVLS